MIDVDGRYSTKQNELLQDELVDEGYNLMKKGEGHGVWTWRMLWKVGLPKATPWLWSIIERLRVPKDGGVMSEVSYDFCNDGLFCVAIVHPTNQLVT